MRAVLQRVREARVEVDGRITGAIGAGLMVLIGVGKNDDETAAQWLVDKIAGLRVFEDSAGKMNCSVGETGGGFLVVSQFTLYGDTRKGRRPSFVSAAPPELARRLYESFVEKLKQTGLPVETGVFQADMQVHLVNDGPVTLIVDSPPR